LTAALAIAQSNTASYVTDLNGRAVQDSSRASSDGTHTELSGSINGQRVPLERTDVRVISESPSGKITETTTRKFDPNGQPASTEKVVTEEQKRGDGSSTSRSVTYKSDLNGREQEAERRTAESKTSGTSVNTEIAIERPTINGSFETTEKRSVVRQAAGDNAQQTESVFRRDDRGGFYEALRQVTDERKSGNKTTANTAFYEPGVTGQLEVRRQTVSTTTKHPDGSEDSQVDLYARAADGRVYDNNAPQQIKERQLIEKRKGPDGQIVETLSVRRPSLADPNRLGDLQKISETVCTGKCEPPPAPASTPVPAAPEPPATPGPTRSAGQGN
jgi:hypothetical protein